MELWELFIISVGLSMDAFAVAVCKGLSIGNVKPEHTLTIGLYFGGFQALMTLAGYWFGHSFARAVEDFDHWIAFFLLAAIGVNMMHEAVNSEKNTDSSLALKAMLPLAVATSIDALAIGVTFAFIKVYIASAVICIGSTTLVISMLGAKLGSVIGSKHDQKAGFFGGIMLILMGIKILLGHLGII